MTPSTSPLTPEEAVERVRMCLAEAGWPNENVTYAGEHYTGFPRIVVDDGGETPLPVLWIIADALGMPNGCWACTAADIQWPRSTARACWEGRCSHPQGPARPPRHLLLKP